MTSSLVEIRSIFADSGLSFCEKRDFRIGKQRKTCEPFAKFLNLVLRKNKEKKLFFMAKETLPFLTFGSFKCKLFSVHHYSVFPDLYKIHFVLCRLITIFG